MLLLLFLLQEVLLLYCSFKEQCDILCQMKTEAEHMQHLLRKTKVKIQKDFEEWWKESHSRTKGASPRTRTSLRTSMEKAGGSDFGGTKESSPIAATRTPSTGRVQRLSPRTAWRTPPVSEYLSSSWEKKEEEKVVELSPQESSSDHHRSHLMRHRRAIAVQMSFQQQQQKQQLHLSGTLESGEEVSPQRRHGDRNEVESMWNADSYAAVRTGTDGSSHLSPSSLLKSPAGKNLHPSSSNAQEDQRRGVGREGERTRLHELPKLDLATSSSVDSSMR